MDTKDTKNTKTQKTGGAGGNTKKDDGRKAFGRKLRQNWYEGQNREIVVYYLIAVAFLELIVGCVAFFYGVAHPTMGPDGTRMANFPLGGLAHRRPALPCGPDAYPPSVGAVLLPVP